MLKLKNVPASVLTFRTCYRNHVNNASTKILPYWAGVGAPPRLLLASARDIRIWPKFGVPAPPVYLIIVSTDSNESIVAALPALSSPFIYPQPLLLLHTSPSYQTMAILSTCARSLDRSNRAERIDGQDGTLSTRLSRIATDDTSAGQSKEADPVSPPQSLHIPLDTKAVREYEYDRQRVKKVADRVKAKDQKHHHTGAKGLIWGLGQNWKAKGSGGDMEAWFSWMEQVVSPKVHLDGFTSEFKDEPEKSLDLNREVLLEELMLSAKVRKGAGERNHSEISKFGFDSECYICLAGDFEVIPHVKSVLVLDDMFDEQELDEPWEHISASSSDDDDTKTPSYAQVLIGDV